MTAFFVLVPIAFFMAIFAFAVGVTCRTRFHIASLVTGALASIGLFYACIYLLLFMFDHSREQSTFVWPDALLAVQSILCLAAAGAALDSQPLPKSKD